MWDYTTALDLPALLSSERPTIIFKHSNSCPISSMALNRIQSAKSELDEVANFHLIDVIKHRSLSLSIAEKLGVRHESPQVIVVKNGSVVHDASHMNIKSEKVLSYL